MSWRLYRFRVGAVRLVNGRSPRRSRLIFVVAGDAKRRVCTGLDGEVFAPRETDADVVGSVLGVTTGILCYLCSLSESAQSKWKRVLTSSFCQGTLLQLLG